ncbi:MAG TPA: 30S ribosomal protein S7 [Candidatus Bipolaricaulota bacterium]|nr:30S ribosomal protein S7 [Candidatus Bipolaricaulota bacterium]
MRGKRAPKRKIKSDVKHGSPVVGKFINYIMSDGKKSTAEQVVYKSFDIIEEKIKKGQVDAAQKNSLDVFDMAIKNIMPQVEVRGKRIGGGNYQVPYPVRGERRYALAFRWIIESARNKKGRPMADRLADELLAALKNEGDAIKKKMDVQRMAEANRAFAHFAR